MYCNSSEAGTQTTHICPLGRRVAGFDKICAMFKQGNHAQPQNTWHAERTNSEHTMAPTTEELRRVEQLRIHMTLSSVISIGVHIEHYAL